MVTTGAILATQVSEYDRSLDDPSVLFVEGIGPIAQYHNYVDVVEEKGLWYFARDYRAWRLNSKLILKTMPPKNSYGANKQLDDLKFISRGATQVKPPVNHATTRNAFDMLPELPEPRHPKVHFPEATRPSGTTPTSSSTAPHAAASPSSVDAPLGEGTPGAAHPPTVRRQLTVASSPPLQVVPEAPPPRKPAARTRKVKIPSPPEPAGTQSL